MRPNPLHSIAKSWQLILLAATSVVLSLASGWTTWIGMRNFTDEAVLSFMITFGIQGVMLVLSWVIGSRLSEHSPPGRVAQAGPIRFSSAIDNSLKSTALIFACLLAASLYLTYAIQESSPWRGQIPAYFEPHILATAFLFVLFLLVILRHGGKSIDQLVNFIQFLGRNIIPAVMVVACFFASIFFSFDALFSTILPKEERQRIAELRSKSETAAIVNRIVEASENAKRSTATAFLDSVQWKSYDRELQSVIQAAGQAPKLAETRAKAARQELQENASAQAKTVRALRNEGLLRETLLRQLNSTIRAEQEKLTVIETEIGGFDKEIFQQERLIVEKSAEADAEERGIGSTSTAGRGPQYRRLNRELQRLEAVKGNLLVQKDKFVLQRDALRQAITAMQQRVGRIDGELRETADKINRLQAEQPTSGDAASAETVATAAGQITARLTRATASFENQPTRKALENLDATCAEAVTFANAHRDPAQPVDRQVCTTAALQTGLARSFALDRGASLLAQKCVGQNNRLSDATQAERLAFTRDCLNWSELSPRDSRPIIAAVNQLERERDDKAHRFVVTTNAFFDGNKLALLAIAIAAAIDALVLASGLIGATAVRSPLTGIGLSSSQTASQREAIITSALLPDIAANARLALEATTPASHSGETATRNGWTHQIDLSARQSYSQQANLQKLVNAATAIGAGRLQPGATQTFELRSSLIEFLAGLSQDAREENSATRDLLRTLIQALGDQASSKARTILAYVVPSVREPGLSSGIDIALIEAEDEDLMRSFLNVAAAYSLIAQPSVPDGANNTILMKSDLYFALLHLATLTTHADPGNEAETPEPSAMNRAVESPASDSTHSPIHGSVHSPNPVRDIAPPPQPEPVAARAAEQPFKPVPENRDHQANGSIANDDDGAAAKQQHIKTRVDSNPGVASPQTTTTSNVTSLEQAASRRTSAPEHTMRPPNTDIEPAEDITTATAPEPQAKPKNRPRVIITNDTFSFD